jgi:hypothetical protein
MQEIAENSVDSAHFLFVHGMVELPKLTLEVTPEGGFRALNLARAKLLGRVRSATVDINILFPGCSVTRLISLAEATLMSTATPVDEETVEMRFFPSARRKGNPLLRALVSRLFIREAARQFEQDMPIWENKIHLPRPVLCDGDGPIWQFRKWYQQFYSAHPIGGTKLPASAAS